MSNATTHNSAQVGPYRCGRGQALLLIAGPCVIESEELTLTIARRLKEIVADLPVQLVFRRRSTRPTAPAARRFAAPAWMLG